MRKLLFILLSIVNIYGLPAQGEAFPQWEVKEYLSEGMRIKIEGRERGNDIYEADEVILQGERTGIISVEGILQRVDLNREDLTVSGILLGIDSMTPVFDEDGNAGSLDRLERGKRVNAELVYDSAKWTVRKIKILRSNDQDIEIKAPVEQLQVRGKRRMEIVLLDMRFQCDENTIFLDPEGRGFEFDFSVLDIYNRLPDNDEERPVSQYSLGDILEISGEFQVDFIPERNFDLNDGEKSDVNFSKLSTILELASRPSSDFDLFLKVAAQEPTSSFDPLHPVRSEGKVRLAEAYILWRKAFTGHLGVKVGRQDFDERREWLYDENLDGVRFYLNFNPVLLELSASTIFSEDKEIDDGVINYMLYGSYGIYRDVQFAAYFIRRDDDDPVINHDRQWYGLRSFGKVGKTFKYWIELALMKGEKRGRELDAEAFDIGFTQVMKGVLWEPSFTLGYAYGSGDADFRDQVDGNFRQTDFEDNNDKFNGVNSFKYYGEVLDPELSNLRIATAGLGFRWLSNGSLDIVYHAYRQVVPDDKIHGSDLLVEPLGDLKLIGDEIDFLLGYEKLWNIDLKLIIGFFRPDSAFGSLKETASRTKFQVEYNF
jgi:alginate production protein